MCECDCINLTIYSGPSSLSVDSDSMGTNQPLAGHARSVLIKPSFFMFSAFIADVVARNSILNNHHSSIDSKII